MIAPAAWCCRKTSNPLPYRLTSSPKLLLMGLASTVRVKVPLTTAPSASVALTTTPAYAPGAAVPPEEESAGLPEVSPAGRFDSAKVMGSPLSELVALNRTSPETFESASPDSDTSVYAAP